MRVEVYLHESLCPYAMCVVRRNNIARESASALGHARMICDLMLLFILSLWQSAV